MKEAEATTKWCPFVRVFQAGDYWQGTNGKDVCLFSGSPDIKKVTNCIGARCMAWSGKACSLMSSPKGTAT